MASPDHQPTLLVSTDAALLLEAVPGPMPLFDAPTNAGRADGCVCVPEPGGYIPRFRCHVASTRRACTRTVPPDR